MQGIEIITIAVAIILVLLPIILKFGFKKSCTSCADCSKKCVVKTLKNIKIETKINE